MVIPGFYCRPSRLVLWHNFGKIDSFHIAQEMIFEAFNLGITHFDLANNYGPPPGSAESTFGKILKNNLSAYRDELIISTKAGHDMWPGPYGQKASRKHLLASLDQSLKRMGLDYVDIFYSHCPDYDTPLEETMSALAHAVKQGKAIYVGISKYDPARTQQACDLLKSMGVKCLIHQPRYSMFARDIEAELLDTLEQEGLGCIPFSVLAQGLLTDKYLHGIPQDSRAAKESGFLQKDQVTEAVVNKAIALNELAQKRNQSLAQMAIAWVLKDKRITTALMGASSVEQIKNNAAALNNLSFTQEELTAIENILK